MIVVKPKYASGMEFLAFGTVDVALLFSSCVQYQVEAA